MLLPPGLAIRTGLAITFGGRNWSLALLLGYDECNRTVTTAIAQTLRMDEKNIIVTSMKVGSLIVNFFVLRNTSQNNIPDDYLVQLLQQSTFPTIGEFYRNVTQLNESFSVNKVSVEQPATVVVAEVPPPAKSICDQNCLTLVAVAAGLGVLLIAVGVIVGRLFCRLQRAKKTAHQPYGFEDPHGVEEGQPEPVTPSDDVLEMIPPTSVAAARHRRLPPHRIVVKPPVEGDPFAESTSPEPGDELRKRFDESAFIEDDATRSADEYDDAPQKDEPFYCEDTKSELSSFEVPRLKPTHDPHAVVVFFDEDVFVDDGQAARATDEDEDILLEPPVEEPDRNPLVADTGIRSATTANPPFAIAEHFATDPYFLELRGDPALDVAAAAVDELAEQYGAAELMNLGWVGRSGATL